MTVEAGTTQQESQAAETTAPAARTGSAMAPSTEQKAPSADPTKAPEAPADATKKEATAEAKAPAKRAPEKYELKGAGDFDSEVMKTYENVARELDLSQKDAQTLIDKVAPAISGRITAQIDAIHDEWHKATLTDKEFGGDKLPESRATVMRFLDRYASPELREMLGKPGIGDNPEFFRMLFRAGKAIEPDKVVAGSDGVGPSNSEEAVLAKLYPTHKR